MELVKFMNKYADWEERLRANPYNLEIKWDNEFVILKYNMIDSDLTLPICKEARGSIFTKEHNEWRCVCRSLDKFGNWGESYAATKKIDWSKPVSIQEKVDGSIIRCWCYKGLWHVSTNGTIDAFKADCGDSTYGDVFYSIIQKYTTVNAFFEHLHPWYTYWFEMVHPQYNQIVVHYSEPAIYYLGCRNMTTMEESRMCKIHTRFGNWSDLMEYKWIRTPKIYHYNNLDDVLRACHEMGEDEEGYVVCAYEQIEDDSFLRIKCKGDEYLKRHKLRGNGPLTITKIISLWQEDCIDDFVAYFPEHIPLVDEVIHKIVMLCGKAELAYDSTKGFPDRKEFALRAQSYIKPIASYMFAQRDNKCENALDYFKNMKAKNLAELLDIKNMRKNNGK